ncbi:MAG TPA: hypothetical protein PKE32_07430 [Miltoncostaeaceae bacterium]|nr:hypothetical protein [Miltoncostaeaceae bacterium]
MSDRSGRPRMVREAIRLWNRATTGLRLTLVPAGRGAQITVVRVKHVPCGGSACGGYPPDGRISLPTGFAGADDPTNDTLGLGLLVHEFGHALGLAHTPSGRCSIMTPEAGASAGCRPAPLHSVRCGPQPADARVIARIYGGWTRTNGLCRLPRPRPARAVLVSPTSSVRASAPAASETVSLRLRNRSEVTWGGRSSHWATLRYVNAAGRPIRHCGQSRIDVPSYRPVAPDAIATIPVEVCPETADLESTVTVRVQLELNTSGGVSRGPIFPLTVTFPAPTPWADPEPQPDDPPADDQPPDQDQVAETTE